MTVVFVPPAGATVGYWERVRRLLHPGVQSVVLERRAGDSLPGDVQDLSELLDNIDDGDLVLVGAGVGGLLTRMLTAAHIQRRARLVLLDPTSEWFVVDPALPHHVRYALDAEFGDDDEGSRIRDLLGTLRTNPNLGAVRDARCYVVARGVADWPVANPIVARHLQARWIDCQRRFAADAAGVFMVAAGCGHHIARDDPRFVAQLIASALS